MDLLLKIRKLLMLKLITRRILPDKVYYQFCYYILFGKKLSYKNPVGFNAKIQWLKVYNHNPKIIELTDKYRVREFVAKTIGAQYLKPIWGVYTNINEIKWDQLPQKFIMKANHGSRMNFICENKDEVNKSRANRKFRKWLKTNYYPRNKEWQYKDIKPCLICERLLEQQINELLELKFFCYSGKPEFIIAYPNSNKYRNIYYTNWIRINGRTKYKSGPEIKKPKELELMLELASKLSLKFPFVRVDFLLYNDKIYFGEMTFTPAAGMYRFNPSSLDLLFGEYLQIPPMSNQTKI